MTLEGLNYSTVLIVYMHNFVSNTKAHLNETGIFLPLSQLGDHLSRFSGGRCALVVCAHYRPGVININSQQSSIGHQH